jgi:small subunit ribosomal protein S18
MATRSRGKWGGGRRRFLFRRRKYCKFCEAKAKWIDHKDVKTLQNYIPERSKVLPRRISGTCAKHQRMLMQAVKRARMLALIPFTSD